MFDPKIDLSLAFNELFCVFLKITYLRQRIIPVPVWGSFMFTSIVHSGLLIRWPNFAPWER